MEADHSSAPLTKTGSFGRWLTLAPRIALACATVALWQAAPVSAAPVTIGNSLANPNNGSIGCGPPCTVFQENQPGATLVSPVNGTIVSWSYRSTDAGAAYQLRVLHPLGNGQFQGAGSSLPIAVPNAQDAVKGPIAASLPIRAGDRIGLRVVTPSRTAPLWVSSSPTDGVAYFGPDLADGAAAAPAVRSSSQQLLVQATIQPNPPACQDVSASTPQGQPVAVHLSCVESAGAPLTYSIDTRPAHGTATLSGSSVIYAPGSGFQGSDALTYHASSSNGTSLRRTVSITITAHAAPPPPVLGRAVDLVAVQGQVFVKLPATARRVAGVNPLSWDGGPRFFPAGLGPQAVAAQQRQGFVPLSQASQIPVGSVVDTSAGVVRLTAATARAARTETGDFQSGIFQILQNRAERGLTELRIRDALSVRAACPGAGKATASRTLSKRILGLLRGNAHGQFRTRARFSATTVRGTEWGVRDRCDGTLTIVQHGVVVVRDFRRHRSVIVRAGHRYLARAR